MKIAIWAFIVFVATFVVALTALHAGHQQGCADGYAERDKEFVKIQAQLHELHACEWARKFAEVYHCPRAGESAK